MVELLVTISSSLFPLSMIRLTPPPGRTEVVASAVMPNPVNVMVAASAKAVVLTFLLVLQFILISSHSGKYVHDQDWLYIYIEITFISIIYYRFITSVNKYNTKS